MSYREVVSYNCECNGGGSSIKVVQALFLFLNDYTYSSHNAILAQLITSHTKQPIIALKLTQVNRRVVAKYYERGKRCSYTSIPTSLLIFLNLSIAYIEL